jgi:ubiquinone/menaquinone biosynthesis C-methylase UbiE
MDQSEESAKIYSKIVNDYARVFDTDYSDDPYLDKFLAYLKKGSKILDLGCGTGRITQYYSDKGFDVTGIDLSDEMIGYAKRNHPQIDFICKDMRSINYPKESIDAISFSYSLFHLNKKDVPLILEKSHYISKENGIMFIVLQEGSGEVYIDEPFSPGDKLFLNLYTEEEIKEILEKTGFKIIFLDRKQSTLEGELPYNKMIIIVRKG